MKDAVGSERHDFQIFQVDIFRSSQFSVSNGSVECSELVLMESADSYILSVSDLSVDISGQKILDHITFKIRKGTTLAIVGPNGAGKTTLFKALLNLVNYTGKIEWSEKVKIGYVPQTLSVRYIPTSLREFLSFNSMLYFDRVTASVGLDSREVLDKSLDALSGGQLRRVLIAWAIIDKPDVLLFDEPTNGIDVGSEEAIYGMLKRLTAENNITLLLISHDLHIVREYSDQVLALNKCMVLFGDSKGVMGPSTQKLIYGEPVCTEFGEVHG